MKITIHMITPDATPSEKPSIIQIDEHIITWMNPEAINNFIKGIVYGHGAANGWDISGISYCEPTSVMGFEIEATAVFTKIERDPDLVRLATQLKTVTGAYYESSRGIRGDPAALMNALQYLKENEALLKDLGL